MVTNKGKKIISINQNSFFLVNPFGDNSGRIYFNPIFLVLTLNDLLSFNTISYKTVSILSCSISNIK